MAGFQLTHAFACDAITISAGVPAKRDRRGEVWKTAPALRCEHCESEFRPKRRDRLRFCSRECAFLAAKERGGLGPNARKKEPQYPKSRIWFGLCKCGNCFVARTQSAKTCRSCRADALKPQSRMIHTRCVTCGAAFAQATYNGRPKAFCSDLCRHSAHRRNQRISKYNRKRRVRAVRIEAVDPLNVLDRDKWRCQICGVATPKRLRGTLDSRAPEVDHIVPIASGGLHSYANTQCACRACNIRKGSRPYGQMRMFG